MNGLSGWGKVSKQDDMVHVYSSPAAQLHLQTQNTSKVACLCIFSSIIKSHLSGFTLPFPFVCPMLNPSDSVVAGSSTKWIFSLHMSILALKSTKSQPIRTF